MKKVLFVCLGNICRSPSAEGVMNKLINNSGLHTRIKVDSAGISNSHVGEEPDVRSRYHALKRGILLTSIARQFNPEKDFEQFDYILAMDSMNLRDLQNLDLEKKYSNKLFLLTDFCKNKAYIEVPDPYYKGESGFELVLDILEDGCRGFLESINK